MFLSFLKFVLKGLKQATSKGCNAWDVYEGNITISSPNVYACLIALRVTWNPWPLKMNKCIFGRKIMFLVVWNLPSMHRTPQSLTILNFDKLSMCRQ